MSVLSVRNHRAVEKNHSPRNSIHGGQIQREYSVPSQTRIHLEFPCFWPQKLHRQDEPRITSHLRVLQTVSVLCLLPYLSLLRKQQVCETVIYLRVSSRIQLSTDDNRVLMIRKCSKARWLASRFCKMWSFLSYRQCFPIFYSIWAVKDAGCLHDTVAAHFCLVYQTGSLCCLSCQHSGKDSQGVSVICCAFNFTTLARNN